MANPASENDLRREQEDSITALRRRPTDIEGSTIEEWKSVNLLSLDGGGMRGYWSLLALKWLMEWIAIAEEEEDNSMHHSFAPADWPKSLAQVPHTDDERARRYFPCHYFDYICGSSTGALIAIMLGRFRMNVADCLLEYETLAEEVFGKPRIFFTLRFIFGNRTKYKAENLQRVIQNVAKRRAEHRSDNLVKTKLPYKRGLCKTFVTSLMTESNKKNAATLYLIRSYDHFPRISQPHGRRNLSEQPNRSVGPSAMPPSRVGTGFSSQSATEEERMAKATRRINYGSAQDFEVWQVARAATAAPLYFEELKIQDSSSNDLIFTDGGFNSTNNPAKEGSREIEEAHGPGRIGAVVSIGTARHDKAPDGKGLFPIRSRIEGIAQALSDPEVVHEDMETMSKEKKFPYYRLNNPGALDIPLDEWIPKRSSKRVGSEKKSGSRTMQTMSNSFDTWAKKHGTILLFKSCAEELVRRRRARISDPPRWERYASGAIYKCRYLECDLDEFTNGNEFRLHLIDRHELPESDLAGEIKHCRSSWEYQAQTGNGTR